MGWSNPKVRRPGGAIRARTAPRVTKTLADGKSATSTLTDLQGASRLTIDAITGITDIVEAMHRNIIGLAPVVGRQPTGRASGVAGLVYGGVRGVTRVVGLGLDTVLKQVTPVLRHLRPLPQREALVAALNGVLGDRLEDAQNPLAIPMSLRHKGHALQMESHALAKAFPEAAARQDSKLLIMVHGLCMNDLQWLREGHDHGAALAQDLGYVPLYLHYNTGRHIGTNGEEFARLLSELVAAWPARVSALTIVAHSMGGLVTRRACQVACREKLPWLKLLKHVVFLGSPHHGAPLERAGSWIDMLLGISPYTAPFASLSQVRSAGVKDLRHGRILNSREHQRPEMPPLPAGAKYFAIAATRQAAGAKAGRSLRGDGLVPVRSALGEHDADRTSLKIPATRKAIVYDANHFDLLSKPAVYDQLRLWLGGQMAK